MAELIGDWLLSLFGSEGRAIVGLICVHLMLLFAGAVIGHVCGGGVSVTAPHQLFSASLLWGAVVFFFAQKKPDTWWLHIGPQVAWIVVVYLLTKRSRKKR